LRCPECRGPIERPGAICPHCGKSLSGLSKLRAKIESVNDSSVKSAAKPMASQTNSTKHARELFAQIKAFVLRDTQTTVITGMACGAILGRIIGFGWVIGAIIGGFATYKYLESK
jgi:hypothetical protein